MRILAIDPGPEESGWVVWDDSYGGIYAGGLAITRELLTLCSHETGRNSAIVAIEMIASYGMAVGREVFETCRWIGRIQQAAMDPEVVRLVYRKDVKMHLCGTPRAKDANIRQALIDRLGPQGTKKNPGPTYGIKSHAWAALAVAVTVADQINAEMRGAA